MAQHVARHGRKTVAIVLWLGTTVEGWKIDARAIKEGVVYTDERIQVEAFKVKHGTWPNAFAYRFTTADKVIVISGDAAMTRKWKPWPKMLTS